MSVVINYLTTIIREVITTAFVPLSGMATDGYTTKRGAATQYKIRIVGSPIWYRVYVWQFSNVGTCFIRRKGIPLILKGWQEDRIKDLAKQWKLSRAHQAALEGATL